MTSTRKSTPVHILAVMALLAAGAVAQSHRNHPPGRAVEWDVVVSPLTPSPQVLDDVVIPHEQAAPEEEQDEEAQPETQGEEREPLPPLVPA